METRRFGRTGHMSTVAIFGGFGAAQPTQEQADTVMRQVIAAGLNHIDIAPSYENAEACVGPWLARERQRFFLGCKTMERSAEGAAAEMRASLGRLQTSYFDLYQLHAVTSIEELDKATQKGGALEAIVAAKKEGLTRHIGITTHGFHAPDVLTEALNRFDFDSVLFPINFIQFSLPEYRRKALELLALCRARDVGTMIIKSVARGPWGEREKTTRTWYWTFTEQEQIQMAVNFVLSQDVTGLCTPSEGRLLPLMIQACQNFKRLDEPAQEALIARAGEFEPLFPVPA